VVVRAMNRFAQRAATSGMVAAMAFALAAATAGSPLEPSGKPFRSLSELRGEQVVRQNWDLSCGAAAIATLMTFQLRHPVSEHDVAIAMLRRTSPLLVRARLGFSLLDLKIYAATQGFGAVGYGQMTIADLDAIAPAIVPIRRHGFRHFVVYRGRRGDRVLLADPAFGNRTLSVASFEAAWANTIGFVVYDPADPHPPNRMGAPPDLFALPGDQAERAAFAGDGS
jgi:uncharacterized protein